MILSNVEIQRAIDERRLVITPEPLPRRPTGAAGEDCPYQTSSVDLRLADEVSYFREGLPPRLALFTCAWQGTREDPAPLVIRNQQGRWTAEYLYLREEMGASAAFLQRARKHP